MQYKQLILGCGLKASYSVKMFFKKIKFKNKQKKIKLWYKRSAGPLIQKSVPGSLGGGVLR